MIQEIGIVVGLYVLTRLVVPQAGRPVTILRMVTMVVTALVIADLAVQAVSSRSLLSLTRSTREAEVAGSVTGESDPAKGPLTTKVSQTVSRTDGGPITTHLGYGIAVAKDSTLKREWIAVHTPTFPADLDGTPGIGTSYVRKEYSGDYRYRAAFNLTVRQPIQAVRVVFLTFDVWGNHVRTLSFEEVADTPAGQKKLNGEWALLSENDVEKHYASIGYVARVRLADGRVIEAPTEAVIEEARKFSAKFSPADLEPKPAAPVVGGR